MADLLDRGGHSLTEMPRAGQALAVGGVNASGQLQAAAIVFSASGATITTDQTNYAPGQTVVITGAGWKRGETVNMVLHEEPTTDPDRTLTSVADKKGNFTNDSFVVQPNDAGVTFTLTATGQTSGFTAQTTFADATSTNLTTVNVSQIGPATAAPGASRVPILSFTVHTGAAAGEKLKRVRTYWNSSATTADVIQTVYLYRGERRSAWISIFGRFGGHTVGFHDAPHRNVQLRGQHRQSGPESGRQHRLYVLHRRRREGHGGLVERRGLQSQPGQTGVQFRNLAARRAKCLWYKSLSRRCKYMEPRGLYDRRRSIRFQLQPVHTRLRRRSNQLRGKLGSRSLSRFGPSPRSRFENFCSVGKTFGCTGNARYVWNEPFNVQLQ